MTTFYYFCKNDSVSVQSQSNQLREFVRFNPKSHAIVIKVEDQVNAIMFTTDKDYVKYKEMLCDCGIPTYRIFHLFNSIEISNFSKCLTELLSD